MHKVAFITLARQLQTWGFDWIDCQIMNPHLESLGARHIPRQDFLAVLSACLEQDTRRGTWAFQETTP